MQTTPETASLLRELYDRSSIVTQLDGPQLEAWVSGLFPVFDDEVTAVTFVDHCVRVGSEQGALLVAAIAELTTGLDPASAAHALEQNAGPLPAWADAIGASTLTEAWSVTAKFGTSIVLGFDNQAGSQVFDAGEAADEHAQHDVLPDEVAAEEVVPVDAAPDDLRHSILAELDGNGMLVDLQLTGPAKLLVDEAADQADRVVVAAMSLADALAVIATAWPMTEVSAAVLGAGFDANQQFVRRRVLAAGGTSLPRVQITEEPIDIRRGMNDAEYSDANRAALSTLQAAVGLPDDAPDETDFAAQVAAWVAVVRGDVDDVSARERDALLWLEWADWLGAGIGLLRAGADTAVDGTTLVDFVNRCPEVSSSIDKADRDYAEWAFEVALDLLQDRGVVTEDRQLSNAGHASLRHGLVAAWS